MKKTNQLVTIGLLATSLAAFYGCSSDAMQDEDGVNNGTVQPVELKIRTSVELARTATEGVVTGDAFAEGDAIAVFANSTKYNTSSNNNAIYTLGTGPAWTATSSSNHIYLSNDPATIYAVYPSTLTVETSSAIGTNTTASIQSLFAGDGEGNKDACTITLPPNNAEQTINAASGEVDYMYATVSDNAKATAKSPTATLTMHHALAMVTFKFYKDDTFVGTGKLTKIELTKADSDGEFETGTATMKLGDGAITVTGSNGGTLTRFPNSNGATDGYTIAKLPTTSNNAAENKAAIPGFSMLVYPKTDLAANKVQAKFTIDGLTYPVNLPAANQGGASNEWAAGYNTIYTVKMTGNELGISVSVAQWGSAVVGGDLTPIETPKE